MAVHFKPGSGHQLPTEDEAEAMWGEKGRQYLRNVIKRLERNEAQKAEKKRKINEKKSENKKCKM